MRDSTIRVSVVIAAWPDVAGLSNCLESLAAQRDEQTQVIASPAIEPPANLVMRFDWVQWLDAATDALIPSLWSKGMAVARGEIVAITIGQLVPASDWLERIRQAHRRLDSPGIGGAIDPPRGGNVVDWATYFLRYSKYFKYEREQNVTDIAGDNASYKRAAIATHWESISEGFWEPEFHRLVLATGQKVTFDPAIRMTQNASFGIRRFCEQRFNHGRHFGRDRMDGKLWLFRLAGIIAVPLIPVILLAKISRDLVKKPAYLGPFLKSLPVLSLFIACWAFGEASGYMTTKPKERSALAERKHISI
jgi:hypothetical protein